MNGNKPGEATIIKTIFTIEFDHESLLEIIGCLPHNLVIRVFKNMSSADLDVALARQYTHSRLRSEVNELSPEITFILRNVLVERRGKSWVVPGRGLRVVVDKVHTSSIGKSHFPS
jgi:hypothetical protein